MKTKSIKTKIVAFALVGLTAFGAVAPLGTTTTNKPVVAQAAEKSDPLADVLKGIANHTFGFAKSNVLSMLGPEIAKLGLNPMLLEFLGIKGKEVSNQDVIDSIEKSTQEIKAEIAKVLDAVDELSTKTNSCHVLQMNSLRSINSNIDTKDFRVQADQLASDFQNAFSRINANRDNFTSDGSGPINETTYRAYKQVLSDSHCNISTLQANFDEFLRFLKGQRTSNNNENGYRQLTQYLIDRVVAADLNLHSYTETPDYTKAINGINVEIATMEQQALLDYMIINVLNGMARKVKEYEVDNGIVKVNEDESPYAVYDNTATALQNSMKEMENIYSSVLKENQSLSKKYVLADLTIYNNNKEEVKGCKSFIDAWSQGIDSGKNFKITLKSGNQAQIADSKKGFKTDDNVKGMTDKGGFLVPEGRLVRINMGWMNNSFILGNKQDVDLFTLSRNSKLYVNRLSVKEGNHVILVPEGSTDAVVNIETGYFDGDYDNIPVLVEKSCERTRLSFKNCEFNFGTKYNYITTLTDGINIYKERTRHTGEEDVRGGEYWGT